MTTTEPMELDGIGSDIVCLPDQGAHIVQPDEMIQDKCWVAGWGATYIGSQSPDKLQSLKGLGLKRNF